VDVSKHAKIAIGGITVMLIGPNFIMLKPNYMLIRLCMGI